MSEPQGKPPANVAPLRKPLPCPVCGRNSSRAEYPFCSRRCADVDLNRWLSGGYSIPAAPERESEEGA